MERESKKVQEQLFEYIQELTPKRSPLVNDLMTILNLSKSGAYKKLNGESNLSLDDTIKLSRHYGFSIDQFVADRHNAIPFFVDAIRSQPKSYDGYLRNINKHFEFIRGCKHVEVCYVTNEVPVFHYLQFPLLFYFKLFVWNHTSWQMPGRPHRFSLREFTNDSTLNELIKSMLREYYGYDGMEMWNIRFLDITLDQIKYYAHSGIFENKEDIHSIFREVEKMSRHLKKMAEVGFKFNLERPEEKLGTLTVHMNELVASTNIIFVVADNFNYVFTTYDPPNFIRSADDRFSTYTENFINNTKKHSLLISGAGERERERTFRLITKKIERAKQELEGILSYIY
jgi:hypothetical protein